jgi:uncharacterized membrane protein
MNNSKKVIPMKKVQSTKTNIKSESKRKSTLIIIASGALVVIIALALIFFKIGSGSETDLKANVDKTTNTASTAKTANTANLPNIVISKSEITEIAKFYPVVVDGIKMEVLAVKAPDGTIRTAMNTCQVCYNSGRGYYKQEGDELVCQNCKNRFKISQVEKIKGGCNPVPILDENKTDDGTNITISGNYLEQNKDLFAKWKA